MRFQKAIAICLVLAFTSVTSLAEANPAMLYAKGGVSVNGSGTRSTASVFVGDRIQTAGDGSVTLAMSGSSIGIPSNSRVVFGAGRIEIETGTANIATTAGFEARVGDVQIVPQGAAKFQVSQVNGQVRVSSLEGKVLIQDARGQLTLSKGQQASRVLLAKNTGPGSAGGSGAGAGQTGNTTAGGTSAGITGGELTTWTIITLTLGAGAAAAVAVAFTSNEAPASPVAP